MTQTQLRIAHVAATAFFAENFFAEIYVNWLPRSFYRLTVIATYPNLRLLVQALTSEQSLLDERPEAFETWSEVADSTHILFYLEVEEEQKATEGGEPILRYRAAVRQHLLHPGEEPEKCLHQVVTNLLNDQKSPLRDPEPRPFLNSAMSKMVNLHTLQS
ncbi:MAG: hypothetical protein Q9188_001723 [Gyalolechia gomerana]